MASGNLSSLGSGQGAVRGAMPGPAPAGGPESVDSEPEDMTAERAGFEPAVGFDTHAALAKRCYRPLSHLSKNHRDNALCQFRLTLTIAIYTRFYTRYNLEKSGRLL
jgi:hypothetical protein